MTILQIIGKKEIFALELFDPEQEAKTRVVNIFVAGRNLSCDDNTVFVPQFLLSLERSSESLKNKLDYLKFEKYFLGMCASDAHNFIVNSYDEKQQFDEGDMFEAHSFMRWGPTTDNVFCFLIPIGDELFLTYSFWRDSHANSDEIGVANGVRITPFDIIVILDGAISELAKAI